MRETLGVITPSMIAVDQAIPERSSGVPISVMTIACGIIAAGSYFAQPVAPGIAQDLGLSRWMAGLVVTVGQLGYCLGLLLVAPLADILENRRLLVTTLAASALSMVVGATAPSGSVFLIACFGIGLASTAVQMIVAQAALLSPRSSRGKVVGQVTGGLLFGILLAWPIANVIADHAGWRTLYALESAAIIALMVGLRRLLPRRQPAAHQTYGMILQSLWPHWRDTPELRARATVQALLFGVFSLVWTMAPLLLRHRYGLDAAGLAWFGLAGAAGALAAPLAGTMADRGYGHAAAAAGVVTLIAGCLMMLIGGPLWVLALAFIAVGAGVQTNHVVSQRRVIALNPEAPNRLNSLYVAAFFLGGATGSALAAPLELTNWHLPALAGVAAGIAALLLVVHPRNRFPMTTSNQFSHP
jgi:predicted MFS family arabinose efflux permease